jgi:inosose dehydratase
MSYGTYAGGALAAARVAYNPLPWAMTPGGHDASAVPALPALARLLERAGLRAIQADVPDDVSAASYRVQLEAVGLSPAPGYFQAPFELVAELPATIEHARRFAADQAVLGLGEVFLACALNEVRAARPGQAADADASRLARIAENIATAAEAIVAEGVTPCLHAHAGTWLETAEEAEAVLDAVDPGLLALGPDNGHLLWAGEDPVAFVRRHAQRVGGLHIKDVHLDALAESRCRGDDFFAALQSHVLCEPGRGDADLDGLLGALGDGFTGWVVIEVDVFDLASPEASLAATGGQWVQAHLVDEARG